MWHTFCGSAVWEKHYYRGGMTGTQGENGGDAGVDAHADVSSVSMSELSHVADQTHAGDAVDVTSGPTTSPSLPRQRSAVYEKYLNVKLSTPGENGGTSSGGGIPEISNSNDDTEREAGEVVSGDALDNQENTPSRGNASNEYAQIRGEHYRDPRGHSPPPPSWDHDRNGGGQRGRSPSPEFNRHGDFRGRSPPPGRFDGPGRPGPGPGFGRGPSPRGRSRSRSRSRNRGDNGPGGPPKGGPRQRYAPPHSPRRGPGDGSGPMMNRGRSRSRSPPRNGFNGPPRGMSPPRDMRGPPPFGRESPGRHGGPRRGGPPPDHFRNGPPRRSRSRSPPCRDGPPGPGFRRSPPRDNGGRFSPRHDDRFGRGPPPNGHGDPRGSMMGRGPGSPRGGPMMGRGYGSPRGGPMMGHGFGSSRGGPMMGRGPGSPGRFDRRSPPRDGFRGPPPHMGPGSPRGFGRPPPMNGGGNFGGPPPRDGYFRGPPPPMQRGRSRSRSPPRPQMQAPFQRDRSWERQMNGGGSMMRMNSFEASPRGTFMPTGGEWQFELKRSGRTKCRVRGIPTGIPAPYQLPLVVDVVQLPHLSKFQEFLMLERRELKRFVYELHPDTMPDKVGYEEYCDYLMRGRNGVARAGVALELDQAGFKIFILPPGPASRALGYKAGNMIAVLRKRA